MVGGRGPNEDLSRVEAWGYHILYQSEGDCSAPIMLWADEIPEALSLFLNSPHTDPPLYPSKHELVERITAVMAAWVESH